MRIKLLLQRDGFICGLCKTPVDLSRSMPHPLSATVGHIVPVARGGTNSPENLRVEHWGCNNKKGTYLDSELDPETLMPPSMPIDVVAYFEATKNIRNGGKIGGSKTRKLYPNLAHECGMNYNSREALRKARTIEHQRWASAQGGWSLVHKNNPGKAKEWGKKSQETDCSSRGGKKRSELHADKLSGWGSLGGLKSAHSRHVRKVVLKPECQFCRSDFFDIWEGQASA